MLSFVNTFISRYRPPPPSPYVELLPDELLLKILSYVSTSDLFYGWLNLNRRFNAILHDLQISACYVIPNQWWWWWWYLRRKTIDLAPLYYFAPQLVCLQTHKYYSSSGIDKLDLLMFPNLRVLTLDQPTQTQLNLIRVHNFRHLKYLLLSMVPTFCFDILCQFEFLHSCQLESLILDYSCRSLSFSIRYLVLEYCSPLNFVRLLSHLPKLVSIKVGTVMYHPLAAASNATNTFVHPTLASLTFLFILLGYDEVQDGIDIYAILKPMLSCVSPRTLTKCHLVVYNPTINDCRKLQRIVDEVGLCHFSCQINYLPNCPEVPNFEHIRELPLFHRLEPWDDPDEDVAFRLTWTNNDNIAFN